MFENKVWNDELKLVSAAVFAGGEPNQTMEDWLAGKYKDEKIFIFQDGAGDIKI